MAGRTQQVKSGLFCVAFGHGVMSFWQVGLIQPSGKSALILKVWVSPDDTKLSGHDLSRRALSFLRYGNSL